MTAEAQAARAVGLDYSRLQQLEAMREAARNENGAAGLGMSMAAGLGFGHTMAQAMSENSLAGARNEQLSPMDKLDKLKQIYEAELISAEEYAAKKKIILDSL